MTLASWQACCELQLAPRVIADYLDIESCIVDTGRDIDLVEHALLALRELDPRAQVLAIPNLVGLLVQGPADGVARLAVQQLLSITGPILAPGLLIGLAELSPSQWGHLLTDIHVPLPGRVLEAFADLEESASAILGLSLLREALRLESSRETDFDEEDVSATGSALDALTRGEEALWYLTASLAGTLGRLPGRLAIDCLLLIGDEPRSLLVEARMDTSANWIGRADLIATRLEMELAVLKIDDRSERAAWLCEEAVALTLYTRCVDSAAVERGVSWLRLPDQKSMSGPASIVLWQAVAWELAATLDSDLSAQRLASVWVPADPQKSGVVHFNVTTTGREALAAPLRYMAQLRPRHRDQADATRTIVHDDSNQPNRPQSIAYLFGPWVDRSTPQYNAMDLTDADLQKLPKTYPELDDDVAMLRLSINVRTLIGLIERLLRSNSELPTYLWDIQLNAMDVLSNVRLRDAIFTMARGGTVSARHRNLSPITLSLALTASEHATRAAKGNLEPAWPNALERHLAARATASTAYVPRQLHLLYRQAGFMAVSHVAWEVLSGELITTGAEASPWLQGGAEAPARRLLRSIFGPVWEQLAHAGAKPGLSIQEPAHLLKDVLAELGDARAGAWDWREAYLGSERNIGASLLLLSPELSLDDWKALTPDRIRFPNGGAWLTLLTERLIVLVRDGDVSPQHPWFVEWRAVLEQVNSPQTLSRALRLRLVDFLRHPARSDAALEVQRLALRAILEFSDRALRYQDAAGDALTSTYCTAGEGALSIVDLLSEWLYALERPLAVGSAASRGPWERRGEELLRQRRRESVLGFLGALLRVGISPVHGDVLAKLDATAAGEIPMNLVSEGAGHRLAAYHRLESGGWGHLTMIAADARASELGSELTTLPGARLGIVAGLRDGGEYSPVLVNVGGDVPAVAPSTGMPVGSLVAFRRELITALPLPSGLPAEIAEATVSWADGSLSVQPSGRQPWLLSDPRALSTWAPDTRAMIKSSATARCFVRRTDEGWDPLIHDFARLVVMIGSSSTEFTLVVADEPRSDMGWVMQYQFGQHFEVPSEVMAPELIGLIDDAQSKGRRQGRSVAGLRLRVMLRVESGRPMLAPVELGGAIDDVNLRWREQFTGAAIETAHRDGGDWKVRFDGKPDVTISFTPDVGAPPEDIDEARVRILARTWDERAQREGTVRGTYLADESLPVADWTNRDALYSYITAQEGSAFRLRDLTGGSSDGYLEAVTAAGPTLLVASDSLSFLPGAPSEHFISDRPVVVEGVLRRPYVATRAAVPAPHGLFVGTSSTLHGLVARRSPGADVVEVWFDLTDRSVKQSVPLAAFTTDLGPVGCRVRAERGVEGWVFTCAEVTIFARASWRLETIAAPPRAIPLSWCDIPGKGPALVSQDPQKPSLYVGGRPTPGDTLSCGVVGTGRALEVRRSFATDRLGRPLVIVTVNAGGEMIMGYARAGAFRTPRPWLSADLVVGSPPSVDGSDVWVDARREFVAGRSARPAGPRRTEDGRGPAHLVSTAPRVDESLDTGSVRDDQAPLGYLDWVREGSEHALAEGVVGTRGLVRLIGLALPIDPRRPDLGSNDVVPLDRGVTPYLRGRGYDPNNRRVHLAHGDGGWTASYRTAPLRLEDFEREILRARRTSASSLAIWYIGRAPNGRHRFEWGYGWTLELEDDEIERKGATVPFFFGDSLTNLEVVRSAKWPSPRLRVGQVRWEVERLVQDDARLGILHQVRVTRTTTSDQRARVRVEGVRLRAQNVPSASRPAAGARYSRTFNAEFDNESEALILERLAAASVGDDESIWVLARLDLSHVPGEEGRRRQRWQLLTPNAGDASGERQPEAGNSVVLEAGVVRRTGRNQTGNDFVLDFGLSETQDDNALRVSVQRRSFSFREATLRQAFRDNPKLFLGTPMLVKLIELLPNGTWRGSVIDAPPRTWPSMRVWAQANPDRANVTVGRRLGGESLLVEARPGVVGRVPLDGRNAPPSGSVHRLEISDAGAPALSPVVHGELRYVSSGGRSAQLLLKDNVLRGDVRGGFTVASMPGLEIRDDAAAAAARYRRPPRLARIFARGQRVEIDPTGVVRAGRLSPVAPYVSAFGNGHPPRVGWPDLSFRDASPKSLQDHTLRGAWHYHDRKTGYLRNGSIVEEQMPDPVRSSDGPLFFDAKWRLRYAPEDILAFAYSAAELLEYGLPNDDDWYPIGGAAPEGGLWVELSPGRIAEIAPALIRNDGTSESSLDGMNWALFSAGDEVRLKAIRDGNGGIAAFSLVDWRPGPRGWFGRSRALVTPTVGKHPKAINLGSGLASLRWSGSPMNLDRAVWLGPDNRVSQYAQDVVVSDVVLLEASDADLRIQGVAGSEIALANDWGEYQWMRQMLATSGSRDELLSAMGGSVPTRVVEVGEGSITVGPAFAQLSGTLLAGRTLAVIGEDRALIRSGAGLILLELQDLLPGVPAETRVDVAASLSRTGHLLWLKRHAGRWGSARASVTAGSFEATPLFASNRGVVFRRSSDLAVGWLPLSELGQTAADVSRHAVRIIRDVRPALDLKEQEPGRWSFADTIEGRLIDRQIRSGAALQAVPQVKLDDGDSHISYLATVFPTVGLISLRSESELPLGEPISVAVVGSATPTAVPREQVRTRLHLSPWLIAALRSRPGGVIDIEHVAAVSRARIGLYQAAGSPVDGSPQILEQRLIKAFSEVVAGSDAPWSEDHTVALREWLDLHGGDALLVGRPSESPDSVETHAWDVIPNLAALGLLASFGARFGVDQASRLAVHGLHTLGLAATGALHQEVLLRNWLVPGAKAPDYGRWVRLSRLDLGGRTIPIAGEQRSNDPYVTDGAKTDSRFDGLLTQDQREQLRMCSRGILDSWNEPDMRLRATARSLLFAVGEAPRVGELIADLEETTLARVAAFGRALTPGRQVSVSQERLTRGQVDLVVELFAACLGSDVPLTLLPTDVPDMSAQTAEWADHEVAELKGLLA